MTAKQRTDNQEQNENKGALLKEARIKQGLSLEAVHEATKIPMDALKAIEEGYTVGTLTPFYVKGFLKMYANYLGIDASSVVEIKKRKDIIQNKVNIEPDVDFEQWFESKFSKEQKQKIVVGIVVVLAFFLAVMIIGKIVKGIKSKPAGDKAVKVEEKSDEKKAPVKPAEVKPQTSKAGKNNKALTKPALPKAEIKVKTPPPVPKTETKPAVASVEKISAPAVTKKVMMTVRAKKDTWMTVKTDETTVFRSTLYTGSVETWMADKKIELSGKNIDQLEFEVNGKPVPTLGRKNRGAKSIIVTQDGMSVTK
jgi:cytoskeleton protein RodZ